MEGWLGKIKFNKIQYHDDDITSILELLKEGKGAMLITSHLGNMELLRSLSDYNYQLVGRNVPVYVVMDTKVNSNFSETLKSVNPKVSFNVISSNEIGPDAIVTLMDAVESGALVVIAGDRTSPNSKEKNLRISFLGKDASFPYGVFLIPALMKAPLTVPLAWGAVSFRYMKKLISGRRAMIRPKDARTAKMRRELFAQLKLFEGDAH